MAKACMILRVKCNNPLGRGLGRHSRVRLRARAALPIQRFDIDCAADIVACNSLSCMTPY